MVYIALKISHQLLAAISISFWLLRLHWRSTDQLQRQGSWHRWLAPAIDSLLLASGLWLIHLTHFTPLNSPWLVAKLWLLLCYIVLGALALNYGRARHRPAYIGAGITCVLLMVLLAKLKPAL